jgi:type II secretory pathway component GspD/PulD (secretin)
MSSIETKDRLTKTGGPASSLRNGRGLAVGGRFIVWTLAAVLAVAIAVGDVDSTVKEDVYMAAVIPSAQADEVSAPAEEQVEPGPAIQSLSFKKDMSIRDALRFLSAKYQKNIVPSSGVDGVVTVTSLYDVSFEQAMQAILGYGFKYDEDGNFIRVYTAEEYKKVKEDPDRMEQRVFTLYYVNSTEMRKLIAPALSANAIVAASTAALQDTKAGDGGDSLAMHDTLVVYDYPEKLKKVAAMIEEIDTRPPAILLEVTILEAQLKDITEFGIDFSTVGFVAFAAGATEGLQTRGFASASAGGSSAVTTGLSAAISIDDVTGFLRALESITDTTVLANPKIIALNKQAGHILIGSEDGYITTSQVSADGAIQQVEFLESGTTLKFRPFVCKNGYIRMEINPEQSTGTVEVSGDFVLPSKDTTQVMTNIMVKDGKTIVIGGLFKDDISQAHSQVPVLGDLPIVGAAFKQIKDTVTRKELIILITPHIIEDPEEIAACKQAEEVSKIVEGAKESLSIINRTKIYKERLEIAQQYYKDGYYQAALAELDNILELRPNYPDAQRLRDKVMEKVNQIE